MQPTNVRVVSSDATTAVVQWTMPLKAYTPETYRVSYSTGGLKRQVLMSDPVESGADFDAVNQMFSVELTGLEPSTKYNFQMFTENTVANELQNLTTTSGKLITYHKSFKCYIILISISFEFPKPSAFARYMGIVFVFWHF